MSNFASDVKDRVEKTKALVDAFNKRYKGGTVYLTLNNEKDDVFVTFSIKFRFDDPFVDQSIYREGGASIYPSEALYLVLDVLAGEDELLWNNTRCTGWLRHTKAEGK